MSTTVAQAPGNELTTSAAEPVAASQVGAVSFSDLVRAHFLREQRRVADPDLALESTDAAFQEALERFEREEGEIAAVYWSTRNASAVALTVGRPHAGRNPFADTETQVRLHRLTDWVMQDAERVAELLHDCDLLAIRVGEILRGTSERIAMRWLFAVQEHLLGLIERCPEIEPAREREVVASQRHELARIEEYYLRTAAKAGRIVYVTGMLIGSTLIVAACALAAVLITRDPHSWGREAEVLLLCSGAGAVGALVSVLSRMSGAGDKFSVDFEIGRPLLRRLGLYKPMVGSVFGVALYFLLASGLLQTKPPEQNLLDFYAILAFFAGFSERFTAVIFGNAERLIAGTDDQQKDAASPRPR